MKHTSAITRLLCVLAAFCAVISLSSCAGTDRPDTTDAPAGSDTGAPAEEQTLPEDAGTEPAPATDAPGTEAPGKLSETYDAMKAAANTTLIIYDFNGGSAGASFRSANTVKDSATGKICVTAYDGYMTQTVTDSAYLCPHAMGDKGYFARPGYVLYGYNTLPDGSGDYYACGWNVPIVKGEKIVLYCQWAEETPASDFKVDGTVLTRYTGKNRSRVTVPQGITEIAAAAFAGCDSLETVILPRSLTTLNSRSFHNCTKLHTVYLFDLVTSMPADSFSYCDALTRFCFNNANSIRYLGSNKQGSYMQKFQRMLVYRDSPLMILVGGSNLCYGLDSVALTKNLGNKYEIVNYGTMYWCPSAFFIDLASAFLKEGDVLVTCPEEEPWQWGKVWKADGLMNYASYLMYFCEGCMEAFSYVDMNRYRALLPSIADANAARAGGGNSYESVWNENVNEYGDFDYVRKTQSARKKTVNDKNGNPIPSGWSNTSYADWYGAANRADYFTAENVANLNRAFAVCTEKGARVLISFSVCDSLYVSDTSDATLAAYEADIQKNFVDGHSGVSLISHVKDYLYEDACFYNSMHHLLSEPAAKRTETLSRDILNALK